MGDVEERGVSGISENARRVRKISEVIVGLLFMGLAYWFFTKDSWFLWALGAFLGLCGFVNIIRTHPR